MSYIGIDVGTSGCKVIAFDRNGRVLCKAARAYAEIRENAYRALDPNTVAKNVLEALAETAASCAPVESIAITTMGESVVCLDEKDNVLCSAMVTGDERGTMEAVQLRNSFGNVPMMRKTGLTPTEMYTLPKLMWLAKHTDALKRAKKIFFFEDYFGYLLTGERFVSHSSASRSLMFDVIQKAWIPAYMAQACLKPDQFSRPVPSGTIVGTVLPSMARMLHLSEKTVVVAGGHDQCCAALGSGLIDGSACEDGHGTCEFSSILLPPEADEQLMIDQCLPKCPYVLPDTFFTGIETTTCGAMMNWARDTLFQPQASQWGRRFFDQMDAAAARLQTNLLILPQFGSSGNPDINYNVSGVIAGLTLHTEPTELYLALKESLAFQMKMAMEHAAVIGLHPNKLILTGGGSSSDLTARIRADVFQLPVYRLACPEAGAMGCMILGAAALGHASCIAECAKETVRLTEPVYPDANRITYYQDKYSRYIELYDKMHLF